MRSSPAALGALPIKRNACWTLALVAGIVCTMGCGRGDGKLDVYPVAGKVTYKGKPIEGAKVLFFGQDEALRAARAPIPEGVTDANGAFELTTYEKADGAPAGKYGVAITWMQVITPSDDPEQMVEKDRLAGKYSSVEKSGLSADVAEDNNELPAFDLQ